MHEQWRYRLLNWWARVVSTRPWSVLIVATLIAVACVVVSVRHLGFQASRNDLISKDLDWNQRFIDWTESFGGTTDLVVVVDVLGAKDAPDYAQRIARGRAAVDELARELKQDPWVEHIFAGGRFSPKALRLASLERVRAETARMQEAAPVLASPSPAALLAYIRQQFIVQSIGSYTQDLLGGLLGRGAAPATQPARDQRQISEAVTQLRSLATLIGAMGQRLASDAATQPSFGQVMDQLGDGPQTWQYLESENGRMLFIRVTPKVEAGALNRFEKAIASMRQRLDAARAAHREVDIGFTGIEVVEADETTAATWDATWTPIVAFVAIATVLIVAFHSWRTPLLAMIALLYAVAWAHGYATVTVGHLQVISVVFVVLLLGLGIAYGIYLASRYELVRHEYPDTLEGFTATITDAFQTMGPGIITGCVTTAVAFATTLFTKFTGVAEMGHIAGVGVLLCLLAMFSVFPALLRIFKPWHKDTAPMAGRAFHFFKESWVGPFARHPKATLAGAGLVLVLSLAAVRQMRFDFDLLKLQPRGVASVEWSQRIASDGGQSIWSVTSIVPNQGSLEATLALAKTRKEQFLQKPHVADVAGIGLLFPDHEAEKDQILEATRSRLSAALKPAGGTLKSVAGADDTSPAGAPVAAATGPTTARAPTPPGDLVRELTWLQAMLTRVPADTPATIQDALGQVVKAVQGTLATLNQLPPEERARRLAALDQEYRQWRQGTARLIDQALDTSPLGFEDFPPELLASYRSRDGRLALEIYPRLPEDDHRITSPLHPEFLPKFIGDVLAVDANATGVVMQIYRSGSLIRNSYLLAGALALVAVLLIVWYDFGSVGDALLSLLPVATGFAATFGLMWLAGMQINPANIIVLPLMFGIGVDSGVHCIYRCRMDPNGQPPGLTDGTGKGITITNLTSMIGFGAMMLARHRGIQSLGFVLTVGMGLVMLSCWTVMPAWLRLRQRRRQGAAIPVGQEQK